MNQKRFQGIAAGLLTLALALTLTRTAHADSGEAGSKVTVNGYQIVLILTGPATVGENKFHVQITDAMGMAVTTAEVEVTAMSAENMSQHEDSAASHTSGADNTHAGSDVHGVEAPAAHTDMGGMSMPAEPSPHDTETDTHAEPADAAHAETLTAMLEPGVEEGEYAGEISLDKSGAWTFNVQFTLNGELIEAEFPVTVVEASQNLGVLAGFFGFNTTVIIVAAVLKRKAAAA
jgi:hypothetical protein